MSVRISRRRILRNIGTSLLSGTVSLDALQLYCRDGEPNWIEITTLDVPLSRLDPAFKGYRLIQMSDIHADRTWMNYQKILQIVELANAQQPDAIVITGDFVTVVDHETLHALTALRHLHAPDGVFAILGNHDHWSGARHVRDVIKRCGIVELNNRIHTLRRQESTLHLVGMDDLLKVEGYIPPMQESKRTLDHLLQTLPDENAAILLIHEPDFATVAAATGRISLQLSGHTHGGQIRIPCYGAPILPDLGRIYANGFYHVGSMSHYTNRGLGMIPPQMRFNCRPEITVIACQME
jgi:predicted MPP superfamily phosphohydrolase